MLLMRVGRLFIIAFLALSLSAGAVDARPVQTNDQKISELKEQIGEASAEEAQALSDLSAIRTKRLGVETRKRELDAQVTAAQAQVDAAENTMNEIAGRVVAITAEVDRVRQALLNARDLFNDSVAELYIMGQVVGPLDVASEQVPISKQGGATSYLDFASKKHDADIFDYLNALSAMKSEQAQLVVEKENAAIAKKEAQAKKADLAVLVAEQQTLQAEIVTQENEEKAVVKQIQAKKADFQRQLAQLQRDSDAIAQRLRQRGNSTSGAGAGSKFIYPTDGPITSTFGPRTHPIFGDARMHTGVDFGSSYGTAIKASASGTVVAAEMMSGYGNVVIIDHGGNIATLYAHQSAFAVSAGQNVSQGQTIGYVGSTGYSTGPHLHFEVRASGNPVDPMGYLP